MNRVNAPLNFSTIFTSVHPEFIKNSAESVKNQNRIFDHVFSLISLKAWVYRYCNQNSILFRCFSRFTFFSYTVNDKVHYSFMNGSRTIAPLTLTLTPTLTITGGNFPRGQLSGH